MNEWLVLDREPRSVVRRSERGSVLPLMSLVLAGVLITSGLVIGVTSRVLDRTTAQSAADAAALAGVAEGRSGAARLAETNGATLVVFEEDAASVRVVVEVDGRRAEAWAERVLEPVSGDG